MMTSEHLPDIFGSVPTNCDPEEGQTVAKLQRVQEFPNNLPALDLRQVSGVENADCRY